MNIFNADWNLLVSIGRKNMNNLFGQYPGLSINFGQIELIFTLINLETSINNV